MPQLLRDQLRRCLGQRDHAVAGAATGRHGMVGAFTKAVSAVCSAPMLFVASVSCSNLEADVRLALPCVRDGLCG